MLYRFYLIISLVLSGFCLQPKVPQPSAPSLTLHFLVHTGYGFGSYEPSDQRLKLTKATMSVPAESLVGQVFFYLLGWLKGSERLPGLKAQLLLSMCRVPSGTLTPLCLRRRGSSNLSPTGSLGRLHGDTAIQGSDPGCRLHTPPSGVVTKHSFQGMEVRPKECLMGHLSAFQKTHPELARSEGGAAVSCLPQRRQFAACVSPGQYRALRKDGTEAGSL